jgi:Protein of unknown function (DUF4038)/Putative collagen-binding domain of a collagenase
MRRRAGIRRIVIRTSVAVAAAVAATAGFLDHGHRAPAAVTAPAYPLSVDPTHRYLVDRSGRPFLIVGDSPQSLIVNLSESDAERFFADRQAAGFNAVWINLLCQTYTAGRPDGATYDGIAPFTVPGDLATPNPKYFARADEMIQLAAKHELAVFLDPIETGGWLGVLESNGVAKAYAYGRFLGKRYARFPNIVWLNGNDFQDWRDSIKNALVQAVARGIRSADPHHLQTIELNYPVSASFDNRSWRSLSSLDAVYTYEPVYAKMRREFERKNFAPVFLIEANYEFEDGLPVTLRRQEYWALLSGASGQFYGNKYTWQFLAGWARKLDTTGSEQMRYVTKLFGSRPWYELIPDWQHKVVVDGFGTFDPKGDVNLNDYVTAARTPDGRLMIAYLPSGRPISVAMSAMRGRARAEWYDPSSGRSSTIGNGRTLPNAGTRTFAPPHANSAGDSDWLLVLSA